ncbi:SDR family NAD(P)-dependent oxidoreductase [Hephaestia sp. GCM10023244]|uniref:SDR family NAD(P)-dependent oxidoreductase n=1 Tax=unclassified Hephaestia TaxID=2631281 RepID=UPI0020770827|nr:SDR family oxidoreductase [Hephaestia sp. MAHUQ-44]MCM8731617.1 SDR family oxidoreductase [Hephaestia sp. MAHUQ-44]
MRLENKVALVTGGAAGLGLAIALRLQAEGASVIVTDLEAARGGALSAEHGFTFLEQDVTSERDWARVTAHIEGSRGRLDILVNNAGYVGSHTRGNPETTAIDDLRKVFGVNVEGTMLGCRAGIRIMRRNGTGSIINIASVASETATPFLLSYGAAKAAIRQMTKSIAQYCCEQGLQIRCNSVHPGNVRTAMWDRNASEIATARGVSLEDIATDTLVRIPMGRFQTPEDIAAAVAFFASDDARHITGTKMIVDGGRTDCDSYHLSGRFRQGLLASPLSPR